MRAIGDPQTRGPAGNAPARAGVGSLMLPPSNIDAGEVDAVGAVALDQRQRRR